MSCDRWSMRRWVSGRLLSVAAVSITAILFLTSSTHAGVVSSFGSDGNVFTMSFVTIGNPNNPGDNTHTPNTTGSVGYTYGIGKFEVSRDMITKFNASQSLQITLADMSAYGANGANKPATGVSWNEAARFINWLNTSSGGYAAYKFITSGVNDDIALWTAADTADYDPLNPYRSKRATYVLPSYSEWYKAAYYNPNTSSYFEYATTNGLAPTGVASGTADNTAIIYQTGPSDVELAGGLSPYGVMGLGGNAFEWEESSVDLNNSNVTFPRGSRGGTWYNGPAQLSSASRYGNNPGSEPEALGFRVALLGTPSAAAVPEPTSMAILGLGALSLAYRARRKSKA